MLVPSCWTSQVPGLEGDQHQALEVAVHLAPKWLQASDVDEGPRALRALVCQQWRLFEWPSWRHPCTTLISHLLILTHRAYLLLTQRAEPDHASVLVRAVMQQPDGPVLLQCMHCMACRVSTADILIAHLPRPTRTMPCAQAWPSLPCHPARADWKSR